MRRTLRGSLRMNSARLIAAVIPLIYGRRRLTFTVLALLTVFFAYQAWNIAFDASFDKHAEAYKRIFTRCGLDFVAVDAHSGAMGGTLYLRYS